MSCLLYCLTSPPSPRFSPPLPAGVGGLPVTLMTEGEVAAAFSEGAPAQGLADIRQALAHGRVVETLFEHYAVIPLRFGCAVRDRAELARLLREGQDDYRAQLAKLEGMAEMGVRLLLPPAAAPAAGAAAPAQSGAAYLQRRRHRYTDILDGEHGWREAGERVCTAFRGLYRERHWDCASCAGQALLSLHFLVAKSDIAAFVAAYRRLEMNEPGDSLLLSGPWPPYHCVAKEKGLLGGGRYG